MKKTLTFSVEKENFENFEKIYGKKILRIFLRRAIIKALKDKSLFDKIFFEV